MLTVQIRKNRISLEDYNYKRDIQYRQFLSSLTVFESQILQEIVDGSLTTTAEKISNNIDADESAILPFLDKLHKIQLIQSQDKLIFVDKELRKYFEVHIAQFDEDFKPNLEYLHGLLHKLSIHILPNWYAIPRTSDDIFSSIIDKYMITPKTYSSYLKELTFDSTTLNAIFQDVYTAPEYQLNAKEVMQKYTLSREEFTECMLLLEYNLVCCTSYQQVDDQWEEIITPFHEWHEHLLFQKRSIPTSITKAEEIKRHHSESFGFVSDLNIIINHLQNRPLPVEETENEHTLSESISTKLFPQHSSNHVKNLVAKILQLHLAEVRDNEMHALPKSEEWLEQSLEEQAMLLYRHPSSCFRHLLKENSFCDRDLRETEKNMRRVLQSGWVYYDDFIKGFTAPIGDTEAVSLTKKGRQWQYARPVYKEPQLQIIKHTIFGRLFEAGIVATGIHKDKLCFSITPFGKEIIT